MHFGGFLSWLIGVAYQDLVIPLRISLGVHLPTGESNRSCSGALYKNYVRRKERVRDEFGAVERLRDDLEGSDEVVHRILSILTFPL